MSRNSEGHIKEIYDGYSIPKYWLDKTENEKNDKKAKYPWQIIPIPTGVDSDKGYFSDLQEKEKVNFILKKIKMEK